MSARATFTRRRWPIVATLLTLIIVALPTGAAVRVQRPITYDGGRINQGYLWGERFWDEDEQEWITHKGVDFTYDLGTNVYAVADGTVVDLYETYQNGQGTGFGNYVLIRHDDRHWDRTTPQNGYVYSIYAHLSRNSVRPAVGDPVQAGEWIAQVDNTGSSTGNHLHLQICLHSQSDRTLIPNTLDSENTSRNPELWLQPFNYGGTNTGTVVGKVTDSYGDPIGDRYIWGLSKPPGSGGTNYLWSRTYAYAWANPDDVLVENWGTTDALPGDYHLYVKNESGSVTHEDLGWHTVRAGETTYVGLYPVYLPDVMENYYGWNSSIVVRNNSISETAQGNTTFLRHDDAWVYTQKTDYIAPRGSVVVDFPGTCYYCRGSVVVVPSEEAPVVVEKSSSIANTSYAGNPAPAASAYLPTLVVRSNRQAYVYLQNASSTAADVSLYFYNRDGVLVDNTYYSRTIPANGSQALHLNEDFPKVLEEFDDTSGCGSLFATATNGTNIAVSAQIDYPYGAYAGPSAGDAVLWTPGVFRRKSGDTWELFRRQRSESRHLHGHHRS